MPITVTSILKLNAQLRPCSYRPMPIKYPSTLLTPLRRGLIEFAQSLHPTHDLTLNFHDDYRPDVAVDRLTRWYRQLLQRLFGRRCYQVPSDQLFEFVAFPEFSLAGHPHFHCAARVPESHLGYFTKIAADRWKAFVPTGSLFLQPIKPTDGDQLRQLSYVTKSVSARDLIHSSMLLPVT